MVVRLDSTASDPLFLSVAPPNWSLDVVILLDVSLLAVSLLAEFLQ